MTSVLTLLHNRKMRVESSNPDANEEEKDESEREGETTGERTMSKRKSAAKPLSFTPAKPVNVEVQAEPKSPEVAASRKSVSSSNRKTTLPSRDTKGSSLLGFFGKKVEQSDVEKEVVQKSSVETNVADVVILDGSSRDEESISDIKLLPAGNETEVSLVEESSKVQTCAKNEPKKPEAASDIIDEMNVVESAEVADAMISADGDPLPLVDAHENQDVIPEPVPDKPIQSIVASSTKKGLKSKIISDEQLESMRQVVRSAGSISKEALVKDLRASFNDLSERLINATLIDLAIKAKWASGERTWRLKAELSVEELESAIKQQPAPRQPKAHVKAGSAGNLTDAGPSNGEDKPLLDEIAPVQQSLVLDPPVQRIDEAVDIPIVQATPAKEKLAKEKPQTEVDPRAEKLEVDIAHSLDQAKTLFQEIFENTEFVRERDSVLGLSKAIKAESLQIPTPSEEAMKLVATVVNDFRGSSKPELINTLQSVLVETHAENAPSEPVVQSWIDLSAKRIDYYDEWIGFEMERKGPEDRPGKVRRQCLRTLAAIVKQLSKALKDLSGNKSAKSCDRAESILKDAPEKLTKAQREWFNREREIAVAEKQKPTTQTSQAMKTEKPKKLSGGVATAGVSLHKFFGGAFGTAKPKGETGAAAPRVTTAASIITSQEPTITTLATSTAATVQHSEVTDLVDTAVSINAPDTTDLVDDNGTKQTRPRKDERRVLIFLDTRVKAKRYKRGEDNQAYFGKTREVTGRRPFGKSSLLDYEIDSEDEEGESLSSGDRDDDDDEDAGADLDFEDGFLEKDEGILEAERHNNKREGVELTPQAVVYSLTSPEGAAVLSGEMSIQNKPFEPCENKEMIELLMRFPIIVWKRATPEPPAKSSPNKTCEEGKITRPDKPKKVKVKKKLAKHEDGTIDADNADGEHKPKRVKVIPATQGSSDVPPQKKLPVELVDGALKMFVEIIEGSKLHKKDLVNEAVEILTRSHDGRKVLKIAVEAKLNEIAHRSINRWVVKDEILAAHNVPRKSVGYVSVYDRNIIEAKIKARGVDSISEDTKKKEEIEYYNIKRSAINQAKEELKAIRAVKRADVEAKKTVTNDPSAATGESVKPEKAAETDVEKPAVEVAKIKSETVIELD